MKELDYPPHQSEAERRILAVKKYSVRIMDPTNATSKLRFLCMLCVITLLTHTACVFGANDEPQGSKSPKFDPNANGCDPSMDSGESGESKSGFDMDLLFELSGVSQPPMIDPKDFNVHEYIRTKCIPPEGAGLSTTCKVVEIDNEMGKTLLEYMSGNYELVMPRVIQEVLMTLMCEVPPIANIMRAWELDKLNNLWFGAQQHDAKERTNMEFFEEVPEDYDRYGMQDVAANIKNLMEKNQLLMGWVLMRKTSRVCEAVAASIMDIVYCDTANTRWIC